MKRMRVFHYYKDFQSLNKGLSYLYYKLYDITGIDFHLDLVRAALKSNPVYENQFIEVISDGEYNRVYLKCLDK